MSELDQKIYEWTEAVNNLHANGVDQPGDIRIAEEAMANVWSAYGYQDRMDVLQMLNRASEIGYLVALRDLRNGDLDDEVRAAHAGLA